MINTMSSKTILVVDDDSDYLFQLCFYLQKSGFKVISASSEKEALLSIDRAKPDLAILDLMMENEDSGFRLSYKLKRKYPEVPIIIATAVASETGISFGLQSGENMQWIKADMYLEKGIHPDQMLAAVQKLLHK